MGYDYSYYIELKFKTAADKDAALAAVEAVAAKLTGKPATDHIAISLRELLRKSLDTRNTKGGAVEFGWEEGHWVYTFLVPAFLAMQPWRPAGYCMVHGDERDDDTELVCRGGALRFQTYRRIVHRRYPIAGPLPPGSELRRAVGEDRRLGHALENDLGSAMDICLALQRRADDAYAARRRPGGARRRGRRRKAQERPPDAAPSPPEVT